MSLRVWLPLNGDLTNNGLSDFEFVNSNSTVANNGKLGKCYSFNGSSSSLDRVHDKAMWRGYPISFAVWFKSDQTKATGTLIEIAADLCLIYYYDTNGLRFSYWRSYTNSSGTRSGDNQTCSTYFDASVWHHIVVTFNSGINKLYVDGTLIYTWDKTATYTDNNPFLLGAGYNKITVGRSYGSSSFVGGLINDVRIYDHALSPKEVKLLSQGLVCHYKLSDIYATDNLIPNGYGQDGATGWNNSTNFSTSEIPSGHSEIKASFYGGNATTTYIPISQGTTYTLSAYLKAKGSGTSYPSIFPYDADKHIIMAYNCADGFSNSYRTTLAQPLKKGDTVIYATDLSAWTTGDNYYYHVAIFGYKDSQGRVYPDMGYTYDSPVFGTKTDKSHINKTNNTITLNSAFTGEDRPAGTVICQATEGATYYYPFGYVATSSVPDWTLKTAVLSPSTTYRLKYAKYINYMAYSGLYHAGIKLVDNNFNEPYILDSSGYNNHGTAVGTISISSLSPRNLYSTFIPKGSEITHKNALDTSNQEWTCCAWVKLSSTAQQQKMNNFNLYNNIVHATTPLLYLNSGSNDYYIYGSVALSANTWTHIAFVFKNSEGLRNIYINGVLTNGGGMNKTSTPYGLPDTIRLFYDNFDGYVSDYREYATALSQKDIQQLYNTPVSVANTGAMLTQGEFVEVAT